MNFQNKMNIAIILMAGKGERFSSSLPKQFMKFDEEELFLYPYDVFAISPCIDFVILVVPKGFEKYTENLLSKNEAFKEHVVINGASSREESTFEALKFLYDSNVNKSSLILIHDGDRPFLTEKLIEDNIETAKINGAAVTAIPSTDSLAMMTNDKDGIEYYLKRSNVYQLQTPQTFEFSLLYEAFSLCKDSLKDYTDEGSLMLSSLGRKPKIVLGDKRNIKITFRSDAKILEGGKNGEN